ncbi:hypothetical protein EZV62_008716 [Acer yangbiense]|uniref:glycerophosphodiester phosphodiesterase n=1 Tax=Acer yangbiense TaxID=1000413 RepID=A0A5C7IE72_9ROSI|nr:hypothetical protein EZV62_008716 [Acer yangbiense]
MIPKGKFLVGSMVLKGPCKGPINFLLQGDLVAPTDEASNRVDHWITFQYIDQLTINGGGSFDGQGPSAWLYNNCDKDPNCSPLPISIRFDFVTNSRINHITSVNSKNFHFNIFSCSNITIQNVHIVAPEDSPNTDGIHIAMSSNIKILNSVIGTGDDCVSMGPGSKNINISNVQCGPGHGISIGSLGGTPNEEDVTGVHVTNCNMTNTMNGVRIKTWGQSYQSAVSDLVFDQINLNNVENPINIDQQYCPSKNCNAGDSGVKISDVRFSNIYGTTNTQIAVTLNCSKSNPCQKIEMRDINIAYNGAQVHAKLNTFNVIDYGAYGDGETDNTEAFNSSWRMVCESIKPSMFKGKFVLGPMVLKGPCKGPINFHLQGDLVAHTDEASNQVDHWIAFRYIDQLTINGGGSLDGQGSSAWPHNSCIEDQKSTRLPISLRFNFVNNSDIDHITFINSKNFHFNIFASNIITIDSVYIVAPGDSPNTDGIHIAISNNVQGDSGVEINDVHFSNIQGTTMTQIAVALNCSESNPCQKIEMRDIDIAYNGDRSEDLHSQITSSFHLDLREDDFNLYFPRFSFQNAAYLAEKQGLGVTDAVMKALKDGDYDNQTDLKVMIQSTNSSVLMKFKDNDKYEIVYKIEESIRDASNASVEDIKKSADSVVINKESVFPLNAAFLTNNEFISQAWDFFSDATVEINSFVLGTGTGTGINCVITGFPETAARYRTAAPTLSRNGQPRLAGCIFLSSLAMLLAALLLYVHSSSLMYFGNHKFLRGDPPLVVAHGGFSGLLPDSSSESYTLAVMLSVPDVMVWCDVQLTKDAIGICFPDVKLQNASNIADVYKGKDKAYLVNGVPTQGRFPIDYTIKDLANVSITQGVYSRTSRFDGNVYAILTVEDVFRLVKPHGLWLNIQHDAFYSQHNLSMRSYILSVSRSVAVSYISSPEVGFLRSIAARFNPKITKLVFRFLKQIDIEPTTNQTYGSLLGNLTFIKTFASGILVPKDYIWPIDASQYLLPHTSLVVDAHKEGLEVFASDFSNDVPYSFNFSYDPLAEYLHFIDNGDFSVDGVLSTFPMTPSAAIDCFSHLGRNASNQVDLKVISKNGASGDFPSCTNLAYQQAISDGADVIDCPVQMSKDGTPFCFSSINLSKGTTASQSNYSNYAMTIPGIMGNSGIFAFNLTWDEIQTLTPDISNPFSRYSIFRNPKFKNAGNFLKLSDFLALAKNSTTLSGVLISIENAPYLAEKQGLGVTEAVITALKDGGYDNQTDLKVMIQSTNSSVLMKFKDNDKYEIVYKIEESIRDASNATVEDIKKFADSVVVNKVSVFPVNAAFITGLTDVVAKLQAFKLPVYVELFSNEFVSQAWDFASDATVEINSFVLGTGISGVITDFPKTAASNITIQNVHIVAPEDSPNTDGIHIAMSNNIKILNSVIGIGDDCVSMGPGSKNINISYVQCGPGHGISIGSLGGTPNEEDVAGVHVTNCNMTNTMTGVRIKTWGQSYQSAVSDLVFDQINLNNVENPINIDQQYCPSKNCNAGDSGVKINDVRFNNIYGTTNTQIAVTLNCSESNPCQKIEMRDINIAYNGVQELRSVCCLNGGVKVADSVSFLVFAILCSKRVGVPDFELLCVLWWRVWKRRNQVIHGLLVLPVSEIYEWGANFLHEFREACKIGHNGQPVSSLVLRWQAPQVGAFKINTDASLCTCDKVSGIGVVIWDSDGRVRASLCQNLSANCQPQIAEALAILKGFFWPSIMALCQLISYLGVGCVKCGECDLLEEANKVAHSLAKLALDHAAHVHAKSNTFNVIDYGAHGDGETDNTEAFNSTWQMVCESIKPSMFMIPKGKFVLGPMVLKGPCKGPINFHLLGDLVAHIDEASNEVDHWIAFRYIDRLTINGGGSLDGQGSSAWPYNSCIEDQKSTRLPISLRFNFVNDSCIDHITFINSKNFHFNIFASNNITIDSVYIVAPGDSPNTDGIHIAISNNVQVLNSVIATGDDCVSMGPGSKNINISNVQCGPGHGISIGSLGGSPNEEDVIGVHVTNCNITNTMNGVRIKSWAKPEYQSSVSDITFDHINLINVSNPIIIDQQYCPSRKCKPGDSGVKISDVHFSNIKGTTTTQIAVALNCSESNPCQKIEMRDIDIAYNGDRGSALSACANAHGSCYGEEHPPSCLLA